MQYTDSVAGSWHACLRGAVTCCVHRPHAGKALNVPPYLWSGLLVCSDSSQLVPACLQTIVRDRRHTPLDVKKLDVHLHYITGALDRGNVSGRAS